jgi:hypothetical protein
MNFQKICLTSRIEFSTFKLVFPLDALEILHILSFNYTFITSNNRGIAIKRAFMWKIYKLVKGKYKD